MTQVTPHFYELLSLQPSQYLLIAILSQWTEYFVHQKVCSILCIHKTSLLNTIQFTFFKLTLPHFISCALKRLCYSLWFYIGYLKYVQINMRVSRTYIQKHKKSYLILNKCRISSIIHYDIWLRLKMFPNDAKVM